MGSEGCPPGTGFPEVDTMDESLACPRRLLACVDCLIVGTAIWYNVAVIVMMSVTSEIIDTIIAAAVSASAAAAAVTVAAVAAAGAAAAVAAATSKIVPPKITHVNGITNFTWPRVVHHRSLHAGYPKGEGQALVVAKSLHVHVNTNFT